MKAWLEIQRADSIERRDVTIPDKGVESALVAGACPGCKASPFRVLCRSHHRMSDNQTLRGGGYCVACDDPVGWVFIQPDTLFGLEEDEAVLHGRARVY